MTAAQVHAVPPPSAGYSVLVVDDEAAVSRQLVDGLAAFGFRVSSAPSSEEALAALDANPMIAVVISDIRMPGLDGLNLARHILRDRDDERAVEVIVMTGHATIDDAAAAVRTRVSDFLRKPFRLAEAARAVGAALERAGTRRRNARERQSRLSRLRTLEGAATPGAGTASAGGDRDIHAISHALRTPLSAIAGGAELLASPSPAAGSAACMALLIDGVRKATEAVELVEELHRVGQRDLAAPERGTILADLMRGTAEQLQPLAARKGIALAWGTMPPVAVDASPGLLGRIIDHAMQEAMEWAPPGALLRPAIALAGDPSWVVVTLLVVPAGATPEEPPAGIAFEETTSPWVRTQEGLRFVIARRLLEGLGGRMTSWNGASGAMALRMAMPLRAAEPRDA